MTTSNYRKAVSHGPTVPHQPHGSEPSQGDHGHVSPGKSYEGHGYERDQNFTASMRNQAHSLPSPIRILDYNPSSARSHHHQNLTLSEGFPVRDQSRFPASSVKDQDPHHLLSGKHRDHDQKNSHHHHGTHNGVDNYAQDDVKEVRNPKAPLPHLEGFPYYERDVSPPVINIPWDEDKGRFWQPGMWSETADEFKFLTSTIREDLARSGASCYAGTMKALQEEARYAAQWAPHLQDIREELKNSRCYVGTSHGLQQGREYAAQCSPNLKRLARQALHPLPNCTWPKPVKIKLLVAPTYVPPERMHDESTEQHVKPRNIRVSLMHSGDSSEAINLQLLPDVVPEAEPDAENIEMCTDLMPSPPPAIEEEVEVQLLPIGDEILGQVEEVCHSGLSFSDIVMRSVGIGILMSLDVAHHAALKASKMLNKNIYKGIQKGIHKYCPMAAAAAILSYKTLRNGYKNFLRTSGPIAKHATKVALAQLEKMGEGCVRTMKTQKAACIACVINTCDCECTLEETDDLEISEFGASPISDRPSHHDNEVVWKEGLRAYPEPRTEAATPRHRFVTTKSRRDHHDRDRDQAEEPRLNSLMCAIVNTQDRPTPELSIFEGYPYYVKEGDADTGDKKGSRYRVKDLEILNLSSENNALARCRRRLLLPSPRDRPEVARRPHGQGLGQMVWPPPEEIRSFVDPLRDRLLEAGLAIRPKLTHPLQKTPVEDEGIWRSTLRAYRRRETSVVRPEDVLIRGPVATIKEESDSTDKIEPISSNAKVDSPVERPTFPSYLRSYFRNTLEVPKPVVEDISDAQNRDEEADGAHFRHLQHVFGGGKVFHRRSPRGKDQSSPSHRLDGEAKQAEVSVVSRSPVDSHNINVRSIGERRSQLSSITDGVFWQSHPVQTSESTERPTSTAAARNGKREHSSRSSLEEGLSSNSSEFDALPHPKRRNLEVLSTPDSHQVEKTKFSKRCLRPHEYHHSSDFTKVASPAETGQYGRSFNLKSSSSFRPQLVRHLNSEVAKLPFAWREERLNPSIQDFSPTEKLGSLYNLSSYRHSQCIPRFSEKKYGSRVLSAREPRSRSQSPFPYPMQVLRIAPPRKENGRSQWEPPPKKHTTFGKPSSPRGRPSKNQEHVQNLAPQVFGKKTKRKALSPVKKLNAKRHFRFSKFRNGLLYFLSSQVQLTPYRRRARENITSGEAWLPHSYFREDAKTVLLEGGNIDSNAHWQTLSTGRDMHGVHDGSTNGRATFYQDSRVGNVAPLESLLRFTKDRHPSLTSRNPAHVKIVLGKKDFGTAREDIVSSPEASPQTVGIARPPRIDNFANNRRRLRLKTTVSRVGGDGRGGREWSRYSAFSFSDLTAGNHKRHAEADAVVSLHSPADLSRMTFKGGISPRAISKRQLTENFQYRPNPAQLARYARRQGPPLSPRYSTLRLKDILPDRDRFTRENVKVPEDFSSRRGMQTRFTSRFSPPQPGPSLPLPDPFPYRLQESLIQKSGTDSDKASTLNSHDQNIINEYLESLGPDEDTVGPAPTVMSSSTETVTSDKVGTVPQIPEIFPDIEEANNTEDVIKESESYANLIGEEDRAQLHDALAKSTLDAGEILTHQHFKLFNSESLQAPSHRVEESSLSTSVSEPRPAEFSSISQIFGTSKVDHVSPSANESVTSDVFMGFEPVSAPTLSLQHIVTDNGPVLVGSIPSQSIGDSENDWKVQGSEPPQVSSSWPQSIGSLGTWSGEGNLQRTLEGLIGPKEGFHDLVPSITQGQNDEVKAESQQEKVPQTWSAEVMEALDSSGTAGPQNVFGERFSQSANASDLMSPVNSSSLDAYPSRVDERDSSLNLSASDIRVSETSPSKINNSVFGQEEGEEHIAEGSLEGILDKSPPLSPGPQAIDQSALYTGDGDQELQIIGEMVHSSIDGEELDLKSLPSIIQQGLQTTNEVIPSRRETQKSSLESEMQGRISLIQPELQISSQLIPSTIKTGKGPPEPEMQNLQGPTVQFQPGMHTIAPGAPPKSDLGTSLPESQAQTVHSSEATQAKLSTYSPYYLSSTLNEKRSSSKTDVGVRTDEGIYKTYVGDSSDSEEPVVSNIQDDLSIGEIAPSETTVSKTDGEVVLLRTEPYLERELISKTDSVGGENVEVFQQTHSPEIVDSKSPFDFDSKVVMTGREIEEPRIAFEGISSSRGADHSIQNNASLQQNFVGIQNDIRQTTGDTTTPVLDIRPRQSVVENYEPTGSYVRKKEEVDSTFQFSGNIGQVVVREDHHIGDDSFSLPKLSREGVHRSFAQRGSSESIDMGLLSIDNGDSRMIGGALETSESQKTAVGEPYVSVNGAVAPLSREERTDAALTDGKNNLTLNSLEAFERTRLVNNTIVLRPSMEGDLNSAEPQKPEVSDHFGAAYDRNALYRSSVESLPSDGTSVVVTGRESPLVDLDSRMGGTVEYNLSQSKLPEGTEANVAQVLSRSILDRNISPLMGAERSSIPITSSSRMSGVLVEGSDINTSQNEHVLHEQMKSTDQRVIQNISSSSFNEYAGREGGKGDESLNRSDGLKQSYLYSDLSAAASRPSQSIPDAILEQTVDRLTSMERTTGSESIQSQIGGVSIDRSNGNAQSDKTFTGERANIIDGVNNQEDKVDSKNDIVKLSRHAYDSQANLKDADQTFRGNDSIATVSEMSQSFSTLTPIPTLTPTVDLAIETSVAPRDRLSDLESSKSRMSTVTIDESGLSSQRKEFPFLERLDEMDRRTTQEEWRFKSDDGRKEQEQVRALHRSFQGTEPSSLSASLNTTASQSSQTLSSSSQDHDVILSPLLGQAAITSESISKGKESEQGERGSWGRESLGRKLFNNRDELQEQEEMESEEYLRGERNGKPDAGDDESDNSSISQSRLWEILKDLHQLVASLDDDSNATPSFTDHKARFASQLRQLVEAEEKHSRSSSKRTSYENDVSIIDATRISAAVQDALSADAAAESTNKLKLQMMQHLETLNELATSSNQKSRPPELLEGQTRVVFERGSPFTSNIKSIIDLLESPQDLGDSASASNLAQDRLVDQPENARNGLRSGDGPPQQALQTSGFEERLRSPLTHENVDRQFTIEKSSTTRTQDFSDLQLKDKITAWESISQSRDAPVLSNSYDDFYMPKSRSPSPNRGRVSYETSESRNVSSLDLASSLRQPTYSVKVDDRVSENKLEVTDVDVPNRTTLNLDNNLRLIGNQTYSLQSARLEEKHQQVASEMSVENRTVSSKALDNEELPSTSTFQYGRSSIIDHDKHSALDFSKKRTAWELISRLSFDDGSEPSYPTADQGSVDLGTAVETQPRTSEVGISNAMLQSDSFEAKVSNSKSTETESKLIYGPDHVPQDESKISDEAFESQGYLETMTSLQNREMMREGSSNAFEGLTQTEPRTSLMENRPRRTRSIFKRPELRADLVDTSQTYQSLDIREQGISSSFGSESPSDESESSSKPGDGDDSNERSTSIQNREIMGEESSYAFERQPSMDSRPVSEVNRRRRTKSIFKRPLLKPDLVETSSTDKSLQNRDNLPSSSESESSSAESSFKSRFLTSDTPQVDLSNIPQYEFQSDSESSSPRFPVVTDGLRAAGSPRRRNKSIYTRPDLKKSLIADSESDQNFADSDEQLARETRKSVIRENSSAEADTGEETKAPGLKLLLVRGTSTTTSPRDTDAESSDGGAPVITRAAKSLSFIRPILKKSLVKTPDLEEVFAKAVSESQYADIQDKRSSSISGLDEAAEESPPSGSPLQRADGESETGQSSLPAQLRGNRQDLDTPYPSPMDASPSKRKRSTFYRPMLRYELVEPQERQQFRSETFDPEPGSENRGFEELDQRARDSATSSERLQASSPELSETYSNVVGRSSAESNFVESREKFDIDSRSQGPEQTFRVEEDFASNLRAAESDNTAGNTETFQSDFPRSDN